MNTTVCNRSWKSSSYQKNGWRAEIRISLKLNDRGRLPRKIPPTTDFSPPTAGTGTDCCWQMKHGRLKNRFAEVNPDCLICLYWSYKMGIKSPSIFRRDVLTLTTPSRGAKEWIGLTHQGWFSSLGNISRSNQWCSMHHFSRSQISSSNFILM